MNGERTRRLVAAIGEIASLKGLPCTITPDEVRRFIFSRRNSSPGPGNRKRNGRRRRPGAAIKIRPPERSRFRQVVAHGPRRKAL